MCSSLLLCSFSCAGFCRIDQDTSASTHLYASLPLRKFKLNSGFGFRTHPVTGRKAVFHKGIDIAGKNEVVCTILPGIVEWTGFTAIMGNYVVIRTGKYSVYYAHLSKIYCVKGQKVISGFPIGLTGSTGRVTGEHLHLSVLRKGMAINPLDFLLDIFSKSSWDLSRYLGR